MRRLTLLVSIVIAVLSLGLFTTYAVSAEQSTAESASVSTDTTKGTPSTVAPAPEGTDSDSESKRGRIGGGKPAGHVGRPAGHAARPAGHVARPAGYTARPAGHHAGRPTGHGRPVAQRPHHHPGHHPGHHHHHHPGAVSWAESVGYVPSVEPTFIETEPVFVETEPEYVETGTGSLVKCCLEEGCRSLTEPECESAGGTVVRRCKDCESTE